jgi:ribonuclease Z
MGTAYAMEHFLKFVNWDKVTRQYKITPLPGQVVAHEFDYKGVDQIVYQENGVTIRSYPAIHTGDGPISYKLEYAGMSVFFSGDTVPNKWYVKYGKVSTWQFTNRSNPPANWSNTITNLHSWPGGHVVNSTRRPSHLARS